MVSWSRARIMLAAAAAAATLATDARAFSAGAPCAPVPGMSGSAHGAASPGTGGFSLSASSVVITGAPDTIRLVHTGAATFKGLYLEVTDGSGTDTGSFTSPAGYKLLTCGGSPGAAITTNSNAVRSTPSSLTWTPPATIGSGSDSVVTVAGVVVVSTTQWYVLAPIQLHRDVAGVPHDDGVTRLAANSPNPFRGATLIAYSLAGWSPVHLVIQDASGRHVRLLDEGLHPGGRRQVRWDGRDDHGRPMPPGVYFYRLEIPGRAEVRRAVKLAS